MSFRNLRVGNLIRDELGKLIMREVEFPGALVTVTQIEVDAKLVGAKIGVSVIPAEKAEAALKELQKRVGRFQHELNRKLGIRPMPKIRFEIDRGPEKAAGVEKILLDK